MGVNNMENTINFEQLMIHNEKIANDEYKKQNPKSVIVLFEEELRRLGYIFEVSNQIKILIPKHKEIIIPLALNYYQKSKTDTEKKYFISLFHFKNLIQVIPVLLESFYDEEESILVKALIAETLRAIHSDQYIDEYIKIVKNTKLGDVRNPIIVLLGDFKVVDAIPLLVSALDEGKNITTNAIEALGKFRIPELRPYFEKFKSHSNKYYKKEAIKALEKLKT